jgi:hypothetical protein
MRSRLLVATLLLGAVIDTTAAAGQSQPLYADTLHVTRTLAAGQAASVAVNLRTLRTTPMPWTLTLQRDIPGSWVNLSTTTGSSVAGTQGTFTVDFSTASLAPGTYTGTITVIPDGEPEETRFTIPITLRVTATPLPPQSVENDFTGDGRMDLLWQDQSQGYLALWTMGGADWWRLQSSDLLAPTRVMDTNWKIVGTGDFNADGKPDIVWHEQTQGWVGIWLMNGRTLIQSVTLSPQAFERVSDTNWKIVGVMDFNADGKPDLLWYEPNQGWLVAWLCDGLTVTSSVSLSPERQIDLTFDVRATGDMNNDGQADIIWQDRFSGIVEIWMLSGLQVVDTRETTPGVVSDTNWKVVAAGDIDGDGKTDLVWQEQTQGWLAAWLMDGLILLESRALDPERVPQTNWRIVGPR